jgi:hypothetical protein
VYTCPQGARTKENIKNKRNPGNMHMHVPGGAKKERNPWKYTYTCPQGAKKNKKEKKERKIFTNTLCMSQGCKIDDGGLRMSSGGSRMSGEVQKHMVGSKTHG